jgi:hypothetical protein
VLPSAQSGVAAFAGAHGAVFGPTAGSAALRYRRGLPRSVELEASGTAFIIARGDLAVPAHRGIYAGRASFRYQPASFFSFGAGLGGGFSPAGGAFLGPDIGFTFAYENAYVVPFIAHRGGISAPVAARLVDLSDGDDPPGTDVSRAVTTYGFTTRAGVRVPLGQWRSVTWALPLNLFLATGMTWLVDGRAAEDPDHDNLGLFDVVGGIELLL